MAEPHILIEGLPAFTKKLWESCSSRPLILTAALKPVLISPDEHFLAPAEELGGPMLEESVRRRFGGEHLVPSIAQRNSGPAERTWNSIRETIGYARRRFNLGNGPVRAVCVGAHQSLWYRAHAQVGRPNNAVIDEIDGWALGQALARRQYVNLLHDKFKELGMEFEWLRVAFPQLPALPDPEPPYQQLGELAHRLLDGSKDPSDDDDDEKLTNLNGAVSLLFYRTTAHPDWRLFDEPRGAGGRILGAGEAGARAYRRTDRLLEQYAYYVQPDAEGEPRGAGRPRILDERGYECVLVKILPTDPSRSNRCDNPILTGAQLVTARDLNIRTVLLDKARGLVVDSDDLEAFHAAVDKGRLPPDACYEDFVQAVRRKAGPYPRVFGI